MKFLASASYDYMKLMVMELQQKLAEIEEMEKMQAQQQKSNCINNSSSGNARSNPFNKNDTLSSQQAAKHQQHSFLDAAAAVAHNTNANSSWAQIHAKFGSRITTDRDKWCLTLLQNWRCQRLLLRLFYLLPITCYYLLLFYYISNLQIHAFPFD